MATETDLKLSDGRTLHVYDTAPDDSDGRLAVFWHHGTPSVGTPPVPLLAAAEQRGIRWVSYDRPGYGGSSPHPGRNVAAAAAEVSAITDALGIGRFAVLGYSGGGPHALACGALLPGRVLSVACVSALAPFQAEGLDWFADMAPAGVAELRSATLGRAALEEHLATSEFDTEQFTPTDHAALAEAWAWLDEVAGKSLEEGPSGMVDDNLAFVAPWGFDAGRIGQPALFLQGGQDRIVPRAHGEWLQRHLPSAKLSLHPDDGHVSVLNNAVTALDWLAEHADRD
jgi:pimeloyl-ACP methyl ester carboxylesterase